MEADDGSDDEMNEETLSEKEDLATEKRLVNFSILSITSIKLLIYFVTILFCFWGNIGF